MFDELTADIVRLALEEGKMSVRESGTRRGKQIGLS